MTTLKQRILEIIDRQENMAIKAALEDGAYLADLQIALGVTEAELQEAVEELHHEIN